MMTKIGAAFLYSKAAFMAPDDKPLLPMSKVVKGAPDVCTVSVPLCKTVAGRSFEQSCEPLYRGPCAGFVTLLSVFALVCHLRHLLRSLWQVSKAALCT